MMLGGEVMFHFLNTAIITAVVAALVLWRYRRAVLAGMSQATGPELPIPPPNMGYGRHPSSDFRSASLTWEYSARWRIGGVYLASVATSGLVLAAVYLRVSDLPHSPAHLSLAAGVYLSAAIPMIAVSLAIPFWRGMALWAIVLVAAALLHTLLAIVQRPFYGRAPSLDQLRNFLTFFQLAAAILWAPLLMMVITSFGRLRGVAPITFAVLLVFGLAPLAGSRLTAWASASDMGTEWMLATVNWFGLDAIFLALALPTGWLAWKRLDRLGGDYAKKRFSDMQLLAGTWWLMFVALEGITLVGTQPAPWIPLAGAMSAYLCFLFLSRRLFAHAGIQAGQPAPRTLLLLRVFGYTARTERLFDRIGARWRLHGPVTMIAAPDVVARTIDPADFLNFLTGRIDETFVRSEEDLEDRLAGLDLTPDPDGRYRVNEFCCRDTTWRATVVALMERADAVVMDLRGITAERLGCEFELQQLALRVPPEKIVLVIDDHTDPQLIRGALGTASSNVRTLPVNRDRVAETDAVFAALLSAAGA